MKYKYIYLNTKTGLVRTAVYDISRISFLYHITPIKVLKCIDLKYVVYLTCTVAITTNVLSLNPAYARFYSIQHYVKKFVSD
jgi:hypothetical protein